MRNTNYKVRNYFDKERIGEPTQLTEFQEIETIHWSTLQEKINNKNTTSTDESDAHSI
jgi:hypothetical protein